MTRLFPLIIIALNAGAALAYLLHGDWKHGVYWAASAIIVSIVTF